MHSLHSSQARCILIRCLIPSPHRSACPPRAGAGRVRCGPRCAHRIAPQVGRTDPHGRQIGRPAEVRPHRRAVRGPHRAVLRARTVLRPARTDRSGDATDDGAGALETGAKKLITREPSSCTARSSSLRSPRPAKTSRCGPTSKLAVSNNASPMHSQRVNAHNSASSLVGRPRCCATPNNPACRHPGEESMNALSRPALIIIECSAASMTLPTGVRETTPTATTTSPDSLRTGGRTRGRRLRAARLHRSRFATCRGRPGNEFKDIITGAPDLLVTKTVKSSFLGTPDLHAWLQTEQITKVVICGIHEPLLRNYLAVLPATSATTPPSSSTRHTHSTGSRSTEPDDPCVDAFGDHCHQPPWRVRDESSQPAPF